MNPPPTNWLPAILMVAAGAIAALAYLFTARRPSSETPRDGTAEDLDARYQAKLVQLREHQAAKHLLPPAEWDLVRARLEGEAAHILRERDGAKHERQKAAGRAEQKAAAKAKATGLTSKHPGLTAALIGGAVVGFFVLLAFNLSESTSGRREGMPGSAGAASDGPSPAPAPEDPQLVALAQRVQSSPEDPEAVGALALYLVRRQAFDDARPLVDRVTQLDPFHVRGRVMRAVMKAVDGDAQTSQDELEHLSDYYPEAYDARMFAGLIAMETNDTPRALRNLEAYLETAPATEQPPMMRRLVQQLKAQGPN